MLKFLFVLTFFINIFASNPNSSENTSLTPVNSSYGTALSKSMAPSTHAISQEGSIHVSSQPKKLPRQIFNAEDLVMSSEEGSKPVTPEPAISEIGDFSNQADNIDKQPPLSYLQAMSERENINCLCQCCIIPGGVLAGLSRIPITTHYLHLHSSKAMGCDDCYMKTAECLTCQGTATLLQCPLSSLNWLGSLTAAIAYSPLSGMASWYMYFDRVRFPHNDICISAGCLQDEMENRSFYDTCCITGYDKDLKEWFCCSHKL